MEETSSKPDKEPYQRYRENHPDRVKGQYNRYNQEHAEGRRMWREAHVEEQKAKKKEYREQHAEAIRTKDKKYHKKRRTVLRMRIIEKLGGKCIQCGFSDWRGLQIDHIDGGGNKERKQAVSMDRYYRDMLQHPEKYQILCANCNQIKRYEEEEREE